MSIGRSLGVFPEPPSISRLNTGPREKARLQFLIVDIGAQILAVALSYVISQQLIAWAEPLYASWQQRRSLAAKRGSSTVGLSATEEKLKLIQLNEHERVIAEHIVEPSGLCATFDSIGGLENEKAEILDLVILPLKRPDLFRSSLVAAPKGLLLYGAPGTGKTLLAKAIAKESDATFLNVTMATLMCKWFGESNKLVAAVFSLARKLAPTIIFIDEVDCFLSARGGADGGNDSMLNMKAEFMTHWDGLLTETSTPSFESSSSQQQQQQHVVVLGATNRPQDLDQAILRRLPRSFEIGLPSEAGRASIVALLLKDESVEGGNLTSFAAHVAANSHGYSGSDLKEVCRAALMFPIREFAAQHRAAAAATPATTKAEGEGEEASAIDNTAAADNKASVSSDGVDCEAREDEGKDGREGKERGVEPASLRPLRIADLNAALRKVGPTGAAARAFEQRAGARARDQAQADYAHGNQNHNYNNGNSGNGNSSNDDGNASDLDAWADALGDYADEAASLNQPSQRGRGRGNGANLPSNSHLSSAFSTLLENAMSAAVMQAMATTAAQQQQEEEGAGASRQEQDEIDIYQADQGQEDGSSSSSAMKGEEAAPTEASSPSLPLGHEPCVDPD